VSIVLVALLAVVGVYYGGSMFTQSSANAQAAALLAQSTQIASASAAYTAEHGAKPTTLEDLVTGSYLSSIPSGWQDPDSSGPAPSALSKEILDLNTCNVFNARQHITTPDGAPPLCSDVAGHLTGPVCCQ